jgi:predicted DNA-binding antitoxin AbrB/MazE fold protein
MGFSLLLSGGQAMTLTVEAKFENGVLKPVQPVALPEGTQVRLTINTLEEGPDLLEGIIGIGDGPAEGDGAQNHDKYIYGKLRS